MNDKKQEYEAFGQRLQAVARARLGTKARAQLMRRCDEMGVSENAVSKWWSGQSIPELFTAAKLCKILDCDLDYLLGLRAAWSKESLVAADYVGLSVDAVDALRALTEAQKLAVDKILTEAPEKLLAAVSALAEAIQEQKRAALLISESEKALAAVREDTTGAEHRLREDLAELRLLEHTQPLKTNKAGRAFEDLIGAVAPPATLPDSIKYDEDVLAFGSSAALDFLED